MAQDDRDENGKQIDPRLFVGSVRKAMSVMEAFDDLEPSMSLTRIALKTELGRSAAQRFVYTLEVLGYLRRDPKTLEYALSNRALIFARNILTANTAVERAFPHMAELAEETGETVSWLEYDAGHVLVLNSAPSPHRSAVVLPIGARFDALTASSGLLFLAEMPPDAVAVLFEAADAATRSRLGDIDLTRYMDLLRSTRERGYAITEKDIDQSSLSVSVPVHDLNRRIVAAANVSVLRARTGPEKLRSEILPALQAMVQALGSETARA
ncbi:MAG: IclR family transcriptional regulator [Roseovarius sp.]